MDRSARRWLSAAFLGAIGLALAVPQTRLAVEGLVAASGAAVAAGAAARSVLARHARGWWAVAAGTGLLGGVYAAAYLPVAFGAGQALPQAVVDVADFWAYPCLFAALWWLRPDRGPRLSRLTVVDALVLGLGWAWSAWLLFIEPAVHRVGTQALGGMAAATAVGYPALDAVLLVGLISIVFVGEGISRGAWLLVIAAMLGLGADMSSSLLAASGRATSLITVVWVIVFGLVGLAAAQPEGPFRPAAETRIRRVGLGRWVALGLAIVLPALVLAQRGWSGSRSVAEPIELMLMTTTLDALVMMRLYLTVRAAHVVAVEVGRSDRFHRAVLRNATDVSLVVGPDGRSTFLTGNHERYLIERDWLRRVHDDDLELVRSRVEQARWRPGEETSVQYRLQRDDGTVAWMEACITGMTEDADVGGVVVNVRDVTDRKAFEAQLTHQALHDTLTGIANRALLHEQLDLAISRCQRSGGRFAFLFCDLDRFKRVNDSLGHAAGDELLRVVAERLRHSVRPEDVVARLGGDEFAVLLEGADEVEATVVADRIVSAFTEPVLLAGTLLPCDVSIGIAVGSGASSRETILRQADLAMYEAKETFSSSYQLYIGELQDEASKRLRTEIELRRAIEEEQFVVHYQPTFRLDTGVVDGVEALVRWAHPERGLVAPGEFIDVAERTGLVVPLGAWVLREACRQAGAWFATTGVRPSVAVNVSPLQLAAADFIDVVRSAINDAGIEPTDLILEITEGVLLGEAGDVLATMGQLRALGVRIALDDFGTGYSSLSYLRRLPVDIIKIDRSFIAALADSADDRNIVAGLIGLGHALGLELVAEGIEEAAQDEWLTTHGCDLAQGFLYARPAEPGRIVELLLPRPRTPAEAEWYDRARG